jgi:hypothetical protein
MMLFAARQNNRLAPILVTGGHRSGTTWVGRMLTASGETAYISEPLNVLHRPGVMRTPVQRWYTYICADNESDYLPALRQTLSYHYHLGSELLSLRSPRDVLRMGRDWATFLKGRVFRLRPLIKDPFALFSVPWFAGRLGCQVVITVRHPAAFASSLKRLNWTFQLEDLLAQPWLMRDWLEPYRAEMESVPAGDAIARASLLWKMAYQMVHDLHLKHPEYQIVRHEDLSLDPVQGFNRLYTTLGLRFTSRAQKIIQNSSNPENPKELSASAVHAFQLDSRANLDNWKRRLSAEEIKRIRQITGDVAASYYPDESWG